jgi:hypothetical protein
VSPSPAVTEKWMPIWPNQPAPSIIAPPEDGKWAKAQSGAVVWTPTPASPPGLVADPDPAWRIIGAAGQPAYQNGWAAWNDVNYGPPRFRKLADGLVIFAGLLGGTAVSGAVAFTMPVGYRITPQQSDGGNRISHHRTAVSSGQSSHTFWIHAGTGAIEVRPSPVSTWIQLDGVMYYAGLS